MEIDNMRKLNREELSYIAGSGSDKECTPENSGNDYGGVTDPPTGSDLTRVYEALVAAATDLFERVSLALK